ncbi:MAG: dNTP triphosphohydrolase [Pelolinea sp.]|nr:dNTP triphosphohydrolase [Pelolinea sp.]
MAIESDRKSRYYQKIVDLDDYRSPYEHDYDRIIYSSYLRRLASVTQIFNPSEGVIFHNRLTHTIKVSQIANRIAQRILAKPENIKDCENVGGLDRDVVCAAALAHDLGNPPFGHAAEFILDKIIKDEENIVDGFEGNAQSFRIVTTLASHDEDYPGLDLTRATLNSILKYPFKRDDKEQRKFGFYSTEALYFDFARELTPNRPNKKSLEASIMDISDDISYATHDLLDLIRQGLNPFKQLFEESKTLEYYGEEKFKNIRGISNFSRIFEIIDTLAKNDYHEEWAPNWKRDRALIISKVTSFFNKFNLLIPDSPYSGFKTEKVQLKGLEDNFLTRFLENIEINFHPKKDEPVLYLNDKAADELIIIKAITKSYIINSSSLIKQQCGEKRIIGEIYFAFKKAIDDKDLRIILPARIREDLIIKDIKDSNDPQAIRLIADAISSLTDAEAFSTYYVLTGIQPGSIFDRISL